MPELPEVETIARSLEPRVRGRRILSAEFSARRVLIGDPDETARALSGRRIETVRRRGKFLLLELDSGACLVIHLGMTGKLLVNGTAGKHAHAVLTLDRGTLIYDDPRQFGRLEFSRGLPERVAALGPDPLEVTLASFRRMLRARSSRLKALLLNQRFLRGLGNIYADESLFRAGIHPLAIASRLRPGPVQRLHRAIRQVLTEAIRSGGSSISDYVDSEGRAGTFQFAHRVYQRTGEPCLRCRTPIRRILVAQRGTHFCPRCQTRRGE